MDIPDFEMFDPLNSIPLYREIVIHRPLKTVKEVIPDMWELKHLSGDEVNTFLSLPFVLMIAEKDKNNKPVLSYVYYLYFREYPPKHIRNRIFAYLAEIHAVYMSPDAKN